GSNQVQNPGHSLYSTPLRVGNGVGVHTKRSLQIRMPKRCLGRLQRFAAFMQQRGVSVPKGMPGNTRQTDLIARRRQVPVVQVFIVKRNASTSCENQTLWIAARGAQTFKSANEGCTHG